MTREQSVSVPVVDLNKEVAVLRSQPRPFYVPAQPSRYGERMMRIRARRMSFVVVMLITIAVAPFILLFGGSVF